MNIDDAIRRTAEAGWDALEWHDRVDVKIDAGNPRDGEVWGINADGDMGHMVTLSSVLLDPSFWPALGQTMGWGPSEWRERWHRLIDDLADGRSVEQFFAERI